MSDARFHRKGRREDGATAVLCLVLATSFVAVALLAWVGPSGMGPMSGPRVAPTLSSWTRGTLAFPLVRSLVPTTKPPIVPVAPIVAPSSPSPALGGPPALNVGSDPLTAVYDSGNGYVYVVNFDSSNVSVINGTAVIGTVSVWDEPYGASYDSTNGYVYVSNSNSVNVSVISSSVGRGTINGTSEPQASAYDPRNGYVYVPNYATDNVSWISGTSIGGSVDLGSEPQGATFDSGNGFVYVPSYEGDDVYAVNGTAIAGLADGGIHPTGATYDPADGFVYVTNDDSSVVYVINGTTSKGLVQVGTDPESAVYDPADGYLYVLNTGSGNVSVINGVTVVGTVNVGTDPFGGAYDSANGDVYVPNADSADVSVLNGTKVVGTVNVGSRPQDAVFDPGNGDVYTLNAGSDNVSVIGRPSATLLATPATTQVGAVSNLTLGFSGGVAPISWTLEENRSTANVSSVSGGVYSFTPLHAGTYTFYLNATDAVGGESRVTAIVVVKAALLASLSSNPGTTLAGVPSTLSYSFSGGVAPITWTLTENGSVTNLTGGTPGDTYAFTSSHLGTYTFYLNATDSVGSTSKVTTTVNVSFVALSSNPGTIQVGGTSALSYSFSGGAAPITWTLSENGSVANLTGATGGQYSFHSAHTGTYTFYLNATDGLARTGHATATVTVQPGGPGSSTFLGLPPVEGYALVGLAGLIVVIGLVAVLLRNRSGRAPTAPLPPPSSSEGGGVSIPPTPPSQVG